MKFPTSSVLSLAFATGAVAAPAILAADAQQPACTYPIGKSGGSNAKVSGRLFNIDGKVEYFAGNISIIFS
jgi:mannan endo-1,4-beta-mannosidase